MSESDYDKIQKDLLQEELNRKFSGEVGHKAIVQRTEASDKGRMDQLREVLADIGKDLLECGEVPKGMEYVGSAAVHIYTAPTIGAVAYAEQLNLAACPEALAGPAFSTLRGAGLKFYGHKRQIKRSGF